jgi:hypothetical protein
MAWAMVRKRSGVAFERAAVIADFSGAPGMAI